jgi:site-specific recombinase XerD
MMEKENHLISIDTSLSPNESYQAPNDGIDFFSLSKADNTWKAYKKDWQDFCNWCMKKRLRPIPATSEMVIGYIKHLTETGYMVKTKDGGYITKHYKTSSLQRRIASISQAHKKAAELQPGSNIVNPTKTDRVREFMKGVKRGLGVATTQKKAVSVELMKVFAGSLDDKLIDVRNRALLLLAFNGGFRRSELVALDVEDISFTHEGLEIHIKKSKTDQEKKGRKIGVPFGKNAETCVVRSMEKWLDDSGIISGPLFRKIDRHGKIGDRLTGDGMAYIIKQVASNAGFNPKDFAGHSFRRGFITTAYRNKKSDHAIMKQTGHKSLQTMHRYIEEANIFEDNAADGLGL